MAKSRQSAKPEASKGRNTERRNGKAPKKNPGVSPSAHNGKSEGGYSLKSVKHQQYHGYETMGMIE